MKLSEGPKFLAEADADLLPLKPGVFYVVGPISYHEGLYLMITPGGQIQPCLGEVADSVARVIQAPVSALSTGAFTTPDNRLQLAKLRGYIHQEERDFPLSLDREAHPLAFEACRVANMVRNQQPYGASEQDLLRALAGLRDTIMRDPNAPPSPPPLCDLESLRRWAGTLGGIKNGQLFTDLAELLLAPNCSPVPLFISKQSDRIFEAAKKKLSISRENLRSFLFNLPSTLRTPNLYVKLLDYDVLEVVICALYEDRALYKDDTCGFKLPDEIVDAINRNKQSFPKGSNIATIKAYGAEENFVG